MLIYKTLSQARLAAAILATKRTVRNFSSGQPWNIVDSISLQQVVGFGSISDAVAMCSHGREVVEGKFEGKTHKVILWKNSSTKALLGMSVEGFREQYFTCLIKRIVMTTPENREPIPELAFNLAGCGSYGDLFRQLFASASTKPELTLLIRKYLDPIIQMETMDKQLFLEATRAALVSAKNLNIPNPNEFLANFQLSNNIGSILVKNAAAVYLEERSAEGMTLLEIDPPLSARFDPSSWRWYVFPHPTYYLRPVLCTPAQEIAASADTQVRVSIGDEFHILENYLSENFSDESFRTKLNAIFGPFDLIEKSSLTSLMETIHTVFQGQHKEREFIKSFFEAPLRCGRESRTLLSLACQTGSIYDISYLFRLGIDFSKDEGKRIFNERGEIIEKESSLYVAAQLGHTEVIETLYRFGFSFSRDSGLLHNDEDNDWFFAKSALFEAAISGKHDVVRVLLNSGVPIGSQSGWVRYASSGEVIYDRTSLFGACAFGQLAVLQAFSDSGIDFSKDSGYTVSVEDGRFVKDSDLYVLINRGDYPELAEIFRTAGDRFPQVSE